MNNSPTQGALLTVERGRTVTDDIASAAEIRPIGPDHLADVRSLHAASLRLLAAHTFTKEEIGAFTSHVYSFAYTEALSEAIRRGQLFGAWFGGQLIGTAGWTAGDGNLSTARIRWVFVRPLFTGLGLGTRLVEAAEAAARRAGFSVFSAEAMANSVDFFSGLGYEISSYGVRNLASGQSLSVAFMRKDAGEKAEYLAGRDETTDEI